MKSAFLVAAIPLTALSASPALAVGPCDIEGTPAIFGANNMLAFEVGQQGCMHGMRVRGTLNSSQVSQPPQHGTVTFSDKDTWTYVPTSGYIGPDSFAITATGKSVDETPGTSVIQMQVNVK